MTARRPALRTLSRHYDGADFDRVQEWALRHVVELAGDYGRVELDRAGRAPCPIHGGDGPNFAATDGKGWHCHSACQDGGDGVDLVRRLRFPHMGEREGRLAALRELAPRAGVILHDRASGTGAHRPPLNARTAGRSQPTVTLGRREVGPENANTGHVPARPPSPGNLERLHLKARLEDQARDGCRPERAPAIYRGVVGELGMTARGRAYLGARGLDALRMEAAGFRSLDSPEAWAGLWSMLVQSFGPAELDLAGLAHGSYTARERDPSARPRLPWGGRAPALLIPYWHRGEVVAIRFRNLDPASGHGERYRTLGGANPAVPWGADALDDVGRESGTELHIVEGELNAWTLTEHGLRAIGLPGAGAWRREWADQVRGAALVVAWYDDDTAGRKGREKLARTLAEQLGREWVRKHGRRVVTAGGDVNDLHRTGALHEHIQRTAWRDRHDQGGRPDDR